ncbi:MAG: hypothetical protein H6742_16495 [Alphaproteobacteria bacterium]|nr:hypothetical protein [Alphaproteobacteria bacterium]
MADQDDHDEVRASEVLGSLRARRTPADRIVDRVGHRGFARPNVAVSGRIFRKYRVTDPWDPDAGPEDPIELGDVGLDLGKRLEVARHLRPPDRKSTQQRRQAQAQAAYDPHAFNPRGVPQAKKPPPPKPKDAAPPPTEIVPTGGEATITETAFGNRVEKQPLRQRIPIRPDLARPATDDAPATPAAAAPVQRSVPRPPAAASPKARAGRFRMESTSATGPSVREVRRLDEVTAEEAQKAPAAPEPPPPPRAIAPTGDSLDDLFGMAAGGDRMRLGRSRKSSDDD